MGFNGLVSLPKIIIIIQKRTQDQMVVGMVFISGRENTLITHLQWSKVQVKSFFMKHFLILILISSLVPSAMAQSYGTSLGLRLGNQQDFRTVGLSAKHRIQKGWTMEGIIQSDFNYNTTFHALVERHERLISKRFNYYYGTGISLGQEASTLKDPATREIISTYGNKTLGLDLIFGVELTLLKTNISIDYKPNINLIGRNPWYAGQIGISARSVLVKGSTQNKNRRKKNREKKKADQEERTFFRNIIRDVKEVF